MFPAWYYGRLPQAPAAATAAPPALDLDLIHLTYQVVCSSSTCARCGAALRPRIVLDATSSQDGDWQVVVWARCSSWRRHRSWAWAAPDGDGLRLGPLRAA